MLFSSWALRHYYDQLHVREQLKAVHPDASTASIQSARRQVDHADASGKGQQLSVDKARRAERVASLQRDLKEASSKHLSMELDTCFQALRERVGKFADWYFAYPTQFRLLREAGLAFARHAADVSRSAPLQEAVAADMDAFLMRRYELIVLQPELNDRLLQEAFLRSCQEAHRQFCDAARELDAGLLAELAARTSHLEEPGSGDVRLALDWASQLHKIKVVPASFEKAPELTLALSVGGALAGKAAASGVGAKMTGALGAKAAAQALASKLGTPFVAKALAASSGAVAGTLAGPLGAVLGGAVGLGADYAVNRGLQVLQRRDFELEVLRVLEATQQAYLRGLERELHRALQVWTEDAAALLPGVAGASAAAAPE